MGRDVATERSGPTVLEETGRERTGPLRVRPEPEVRRARPADGRRPRAASTIGGLGQTSAESLVARVDGPLAPALRILDHEQANVRESQLARVDDLHGDDLAATSKPRQRRAPGVGGGDEVGDHDREPASSLNVSEIVNGATEVDRSPER